MNNYGVIVADPPWQYRNGGNGAAANHYPTMQTADICDLRVHDQPVSQLGADDSILLMWCTWPLLPDGLEIIQKWGYEYITGFPWLKLGKPLATNLFGEVEVYPAFGTGVWVRGCSEFVMVARRGKPKPPEQTFLGILGERMKHSRKPETLYDYAEAMAGPYLELFARRERTGWDTWGNEL